MKFSLIHQALCILFTTSVVLGQGYVDQQDYYAQDDFAYYGQEGDSLYHDHIAHQEKKAEGGKGGTMKTMAFCAGSWFLGGKIHSKRAVKKANDKFSKSQREFYLKYVKDVNSLQKQNAELQEYMTEVMKQKLTEEFLAADLNNDRQVTRAEFEMYKKEYIKKHPETKNVQFPAFEEFDPDHNGVISMREHENYYERQGVI